MRQISEGNFLPEGTFYELQKSKTHSKINKNQSRKKTMSGLPFLHLSQHQVGKPRKGTSEFYLEL